MTTYLQHNRVQLALHDIRPGDGRPLLLLHGLGERSVDTAPPWPGPVHALDFTGHGDSTVPCCGGYSAELLMADADIALAHVGPSTLLARGIGAYVALLLAGARPELVRGAILDDGPGLYGGPAGPTSALVLEVDDHESGPPDPWALLELSTDVRTPDYAVAYARHAVERSGLAEPISVIARNRPAWLAGVLDALLASTATLEEALARYAG